MIMLPGGEEQLNFCTEQIDVTDFNIALFGSASEGLAFKFAQLSGRQVELAVEDYDSFINARLVLGGKEEFVRTRTMEFSATDLNKNSMDLVFCQGSVSDGRRNDILKEIRRVLKPGGYACIGELVKRNNEIPVAATDIFERSNIIPLLADEMQDYYSKRNFEFIAEKDLSFTLADFYASARVKLKDGLEHLTEGEEKLFKKLIKKIKHESDFYVNYGGDKYIGFKCVLLRYNG